MLQLRLSLCADTPASHRGGRFPWPGWTEAALEMLCMRWTPQAPNHPLAQQDWQADVCDRAGELSREGHVFYRLSSDLNGTSVNDAKPHHPPSTPRSQLPTYISICQLSSSCSVPVKYPGFSPLSVIMLNCWDQILVTLELPNNPLLFFLSFYLLLLISVSQYRAQHRDNALQQDTGMPASLLRIVS